MASISKDESLSPSLQLTACIFFFLSGAAALVYEVAWMRLLGLVFGNTTFAISTVLATYMAGLGLGSFAIGRLADRLKSPLLVYGFLELGIGAYAAMTFPILKFVQWAYVGAAGAFGLDFARLTALRLALTFLVLFVPTFLMGGTLPVLVKFFSSRGAKVGPQIAFLYGLNTLGAVAGTLGAGFLLLPRAGTARTLFFAVGLNLIIGAWACLLCLKQDEAASTPSPKDASPKSASGGARAFPPAFLLAGLFISGISAMLYEVGWTRILASVLGSSTYAFTIMLAAFLLGIGLGSMALKKLLTRKEMDLTHWAQLQLFIGLWAIVTLPVFAWVPAIVVRFYALSIGHFTLFQILLFSVCGLLMLVPALGFGALFPLSTALYVGRDQSVGHKVGNLYLANTAGNLLGSLGAGFLLIPWVGIHKTLLIAVALGTLMALAALLAQKALTARQVTTALMSLLVLGGVWHQKQKGWDAELLTSGLQLRPESSVAKKTQEILSAVYGDQVLFYKEGLSSIVSVGQMGGARFLKVNGKTDASNRLDMVTQLLCGHLPHLLHPAPKKTLVIGYGSGATVAASLAHPIDRLDSVEIEPAVYEAAPYFDEINRKSYTDPRAHLAINDGRNFLLTSGQTYDVIASEPSNPWIAGIANLFTVEFYTLAKQRLNEDGLFCQWLQQYGISPADFQMVVATVRSVFPYVTVWQASQGDTLIIAGQKPVRFNHELIRQRIGSLPLVREDLARFQIHGPGGLAPYFILGDEDVTRLTGNAQVNTDDLLPLEYNTPKTLSEDTEMSIRNLMATHRTTLSAGFLGRFEDDAPTLIQTAQAYIYLKDYDLADKGLAKALLLAPDNKEASFELARSLTKRGKILKALALIENDSTAPTHLLRAQIFLTQDKPEEALAWIEKADALGTGNWETAFWKGQVLDKLSRPREAAEAYNQSLSLNPDTLEVLPISLMHAKALRKSGQSTEALASLETLKKSYTTYYPVFQELKENYTATNNPAPAIAAYEQFLKQNPYHVDAWIDLAQLYSITGDKQKLADIQRRLYKLKGF